MNYKLTAVLLAALTLAAGCRAASQVKGNGLAAIKQDRNGNVIENIVYIEVNNDDPRVALGYAFENTGIQFFDYVVLFAANLRNRDCKAELEAGETGHDCTKRGVHLHYNGNLSHILENRDKYIKPLQDSGIKVLLGLLGDWGGVGFGSFGSWPMEDVYPWTTAGNPANPQGGAYPYTVEARRAFIEEAAAEVKRLGLDGIDIDDEWGSGGDWPANQKGLCIYPDQAGYYDDRTAEDAAWARCGVNLANFLVNARDALGPDAIINVYEYNSARYMNIPANTRIMLENGRFLTTINGYYDYSVEAVYGAWSTDGYNGHPHMRYAPVGIDIAGEDNPSSPRPPIRGAPLTIAECARMELAVKRPYGVNMFYGLRSHEAAARPYGKEAHPKLWDAEEKRLLTQTEYLSLFSEVLYGRKIVYYGKDFPQDWTRR
ncbi:MAG: hypothetical protein LBD07_00280 [Spirochaetaceae bacterium]|jgi:hypothetical protein|nr:hypothetical protein [Spirochaetaceae bacterium]